MPEIAWSHLCAGVALCLMGWTLYWAGLHLAGALLGGLFGLGAAWAGAVATELDPGQAWWLLALGGVVGFVAGVFLMRGAHRFFFFFAGAALGLAVGQVAYDWCSGHVTAIHGQGEIWRGVFIVVGSLAGGVAMVLGSRWVVALVTSVVGSALIVLSVSDPLALLAFIPLVAASFALQIGLLRRLMPKPSPVSEEEEE